MADLFLDIRDRLVRAIVSDNGTVLLQQTYTQPPTGGTTVGSHNEQASDGFPLGSGELATLISTIRSDANVSLEHAHVILPTAVIKKDAHRLPRMAQQDALALLTRKIAEKSGDETPQISVIPMAIEQNHQEWLAEFVPSAAIRELKKELSGARVTLKSATSALDSTLHAIAHIRESIFNAHAIFEINPSGIEAYFVSSTSLLLHETLSLNSDDDQPHQLDDSRAQKRRVFAILDILHRITSQFQSAHPMTPLQKVWLCGTEPNIEELSTTLQDAMDIETVLLANDGNNAYVALNGFQDAYTKGHLTNLIHPDLLRRFPLRKKTGLLVYVLTALLTAFVVVTTEYRHHKLTDKATAAKKSLAAQKTSQAASASFAKNLDLLRKLSGSQIVFYPIFRDLAMNLPEGVYLESFVFTNKDTVDSVEMTASFLQTTDLGTRKTLTRLMDSLKQSPYLKIYREPSVTSVTKNSIKTMVIKFTCEVRPVDTAK